MRERARAIGARFTLESAPGEGTRVRLRVRLAPRAFGLPEILARWRAARVDGARRTPGKNP